MIADADEVAAIGFKAVHAQGISGVQRVDDRVLAAMEESNDVAPAHNPPYVRAMRMLADRFPEIPLVAAFETGFHATIPDRDPPLRRPRGVGDRPRRSSAGASTAPATATSPSGSAELLGPAGPPGHLLPPRRQLVALRHQGRQVRGDQHGHEPPDRPPPQQPRRRLRPLRPARPDAGDGDDAGGVARRPRHEVGPARDSAASSDLRDVEAKADAGDPRAKLAIDMFVTSIRHYLGAYLVELGGADAIVFTAGIGENSPRIRAAVLAGPRPLLRHPPERGAERRRAPASEDLERATAASRSGSCPPTRRSSSPARPATCSPARPDPRDRHSGPRRCSSPA